MESDKGRNKKVTKEGRHASNLVGVRRNTAKGEEEGKKRLWWVPLSSVKRRASFFSSSSL